MAKKNSNLHTAKAVKNDEFYTRLEDIENELKHYREHFDDKVVLCPCDESEHTNFYKHFMLNFDSYNIRKLICVGYRQNRPAEVHIVERRGNEIVEKNERLIGNGDFRNIESQKFLMQADVVVTNPPFSLLREFLNWIMGGNKKFLIIGPQNAITYKEVFALIKDNKIWLGNTHPKRFMDKNNGMADKSFGNICWFTNMEISKRKFWLDTGIEYEYGMKRGWYEKYDNYNAINIDKTSNIPMDYDGVMGVPISFLEKHNPDQFEIVKFRKGDDDKDLRIGEKQPYFRILIRKKL